MRTKAAVMQKQKAGRKSRPAAFHPCNHHPASITPASTTLMAIPAAVDMKLLVWE